MQGFSAILGQAKAVELLQGALNSEKVAHAYLFSGPQGVGKKLTASVFARGLNCEASVSRPCDSCLSCQKALHQNHPDIISLRPEGASLKIEQVRALQKTVYAKIYEGRYKVFMLEDIHTATVQAFNSLLKMLEEPPDRSVFILITDNHQTIPATVVSRCQRVNFAPLSSELIEEVLVDRGYSAEKAREAADLAYGSLGKAIEIADNQQLAVIRQQAIWFLQGALQQSYFRIFKVIESLEKEKIDIGQLLEQLLFLLRDFYRLQIDGQGQEGSELKALGAVSIAPQQVQKALKLVLEAGELYRKQANHRLLLDVLGLGLGKLA